MSPLFYNGPGGGPAPNAGMPKEKGVTRRMVISWVSILLLYLSFCFYDMNGVRAQFTLIPQYLQMLYPSGGNNSEIAAGFWIYFVSGIIELLIFECVARLYFMMMRMTMPFMDYRGMIFYLRFFYLGRNILLGLLRLLYLVTPLAYIYVETVLTMLLTTLVLFAFFFYVRGKCFPKEQSYRAVRMLGAPYFAIMLIYTVISIFLPGVF